MVTLVTYRGPTRPDSSTTTPYTGLGPHRVTQRSAPRVLRRNGKTRPRTPQYAHTRSGSGPTLTDRDRDNTRSGTLSYVLEGPLYDDGGTALASGVAPRHTRPSP